MEIIKVNLRENDEFIKLGQAMKKAGLEESGVDVEGNVLEADEVFDIGDGRYLIVEG